MKRAWIAAAASAVALLGCAHGKGDGWQMLIDGDQGLENFERVGDANWRGEGGAIVADRGKSGFLVTKNSYRDFQVRAEFWAEGDTNSGVFIRCDSKDQINAKNCYEVNIWDTRPDPKFGTGAIVDVKPVSVPLKVRAGGKWNTYEISAKGSQLTVKLNGVETAIAQDGRHVEGPFGLQYATGGINGAQGGPIKWRKVQVRSL
jgi:hypothetical protein